MNIQQFTPIQYIWFVIYLSILIVCIICSIKNVIKNNKKFNIFYGLELTTILINVLFMYLIDNYIEYGNDKFSGLSQLGDWVGHIILIIITIILIIITLICHLIYYFKNKNKKISEINNIKKYSKIE